LRFSFDNFGACLPFLYSRPLSLERSLVIRGENVLFPPSSSATDCPRFLPLARSPRWRLRLEGRPKGFSSLSCPLSMFSPSTRDLFLDTECCEALCLLEDCRRCSFSLEDMPSWTPPLYLFGLFFLGVACFDLVEVLFPGVLHGDPPLSGVQRHSLVPSHKLASLQSINPPRACGPGPFSFDRYPCS